MRPAVLAATLASIAATLASATRRARGHVPRGVRTTTEYAQDKLRALRARALMPEVVAAYENHARFLMPALPYSAYVAFTASSTGPGERVPLGLWGLERSWVRRYLERHGAAEGARTVDDVQRSVAAQAMLGAVRYAEALVAARDAARARGREVAVDLTRWGPWEYALAVCAYSAGQGTCAALLATAPRTILDVPPAERWTMLARALAPEVLSRPRVGGVRSIGTAGAAWALVRPRERYECGRIIASPGELDWYASPAWPHDLDLRLSRRAWER